MFILFHHSLILLVDIKHFANTLGSLLSLGRAGESMVVGGDVGHDGTLIRLRGGMDVCQKRNTIYFLICYLLNKQYPIKKIHFFTFKNIFSNCVHNHHFCL